jgi:hypothetical protein
VRRRVMGDPLAVHPLVLPRGDERSPLPLLERA